MQEASDLCLAYGGSLSGEHGDGQAKGELLPKMFGPELIEAFRDFKAIWDPAGRMNPGKVIDAYPLDTNLRLGPEYPEAGRDLVQISRRQRQLCARGRALLWRRKMPQPRRPDDVPELSGDARGDAFDARPRASVVRDDARRLDQGRLARPAYERGARPLPAMQGVQGRLPGQRRYGDVQGRVSRALLPGPAAPARGLCDGADLPLGAARRR